MKTKDVNLIQESNADITDDFVLGVKKGAIKKFKFLSVFAQLNASIWTNSVHPDDLYKHVNAGISISLVVPNTVGLPSNAGMLMHIQRWQKESVSGAQSVFQIIFDEKGRLFYRFGLGNGTKIIYAPWKYVKLEAI